MKVLSILQPWASLVVTTDPKTGKAYKQIETRSWDTKFRGPLLIHASKAYSKEQEAFAHSIYMDVKDSKIYHNHRGAIIGMVNVVGTFQSELNKIGCWYQVDNVTGKQFDWEMTEQELAFGNYEPGRYGWLLSEPVLFKNPIPCKGNLSIWNLPRTGNLWDQVIHELKEATGFEYDCNEEGKIERLASKPFTPSLIASSSEGAVIVEPVKNCYSCKHYERTTPKKAPCFDCDEDFSLYESIKPLTSSQPEKTVGQIITEAMRLHELVPETVESVQDFPKGYIRKIMNDEVYTNSIPVVLFKNLLLSLHIRFCDIEPAFIPTYKLLKSKETEEDLKKKPHGYMLWENEEALYKYTSRLNELMAQSPASQLHLPSRGIVADGHDQLMEELRKSEIN